MSRVHDMGGRFGDSVIMPEAEDDLVFYEEWHGRALAITLAAGALGKWNIDISRHAQNACRLSITHPCHITKNGWRVWLGCWWTLIS